MFVLYNSSSSAAVGQPVNAEMAIANSEVMVSAPVAPVPGPLTTQV